MTRSLLLRGVAVASVLGLALTGCTTEDPDEPGGGDGGDCDAYADYEGHDGTSVSIYTPITDVEADNYEASWDEFESCTGITIDWEGNDQFEDQVPVRAQGGNPPDLIFAPQPGLIQTLHDGGYLVPAPDEVASLVDEFWAEGWADYATIDGTFYGAPMSANMKSLVWYSPGFFEENGLAVPETWDDLLALTDEIAATGIKPWCAGIESDAATGWPATDWVEDVFLRLHGTDPYQQWIDHAIPFNDPMVVESFDMVGEILKNEDYVNGGLGDVSTIATTAFQDGGLPILEGECALHRQASFYGAQWGEGIEVAEDGDVFAFYLPVIDPAGPSPVLGGGEFVVAFDDRPEVAAVQTYLATAEYATSRAEQGAWASANSGVPIDTYTDPVFRLVAETMANPEAAFAFDASDLMPSEVNQTYLPQITEWVLGQDTQTTVDAVEGSWP